jgi:hypothetical protein
MVGVRDLPSGRPGGPHDSVCKSDRACRGGELLRLERSSPHAAAWEQGGNEIGRGTLRLAASPRPKSGATPGGTR